MSHHNLRRNRNQPNYSELYPDEMDELEQDDDEEDDPRDATFHGSGHSRRDQSYKPERRQPPQPQACYQQSFQVQPAQYQQQRSTDWLSDNKDMPVVAWTRTLVKRSHIGQMQGWMRSAIPWQKPNTTPNITEEVSEVKEEEEDVGDVEMVRTVSEVSVVGADGDTVTDE